VRSESLNGREDVRGLEQEPKQVELSDRGRNVAEDVVFFDRDENFGRHPVDVCCLNREEFESRTVVEDTS